MEDFLSPIFIIINTTEGSINDESCVEQLEFG